MTKDKVIGLLVSLVIIGIGTLSLFRSREMQERQTRGLSEESWLYRQLTSLGATASTKISGAFFIVVGVLLLFLTLIK